ncbi:MAG: hypothetical protein CMK07_05755 [Ponticaulis sp.]|nr:hypothetical protein [Ponticaulis sp.]
MNVSWRHTLAAGTAVALASTLGLAFAGGTGGQSGTVPGVTIGAATNPNTSACCDGGNHVITPPGVSVPGPNLVYTPGSAKVGSQYIVGGYEAEASYSGWVGVDTRTTFLSNGSYIPMAEPIQPSVIDLNVAGSTQAVEVVAEQVAVQEEVCEEQIVSSFATFPVQAVCLDDTGTPHPASRVDDGDLIAGGFSGEVFRCMAGTNMQVTIGELVNGTPSFEHASGFSCAKGEALIHKPGGELACAPQIPQRNCNERSLLRRYGPGIKLIETTMQKKVCAPAIKTRYETVEREVVVDKPLPSLPIMLDGGVGMSTQY